MSEKSYRGIKKRFVEDEGKNRKFLDIHAREEDIRFLKKTGQKWKAKRLKIRQR